MNVHAHVEPAQQRQSSLGALPVSSMIESPFTAATAAPCLFPWLCFHLLTGCLHGSRVENLRLVFRVSVSSVKRTSRPVLEEDPGLWKASSDKFKQQRSGFQLQGPLLPATGGLRWQTALGRSLGRPSSSCRRRFFLCPGKRSGET